MARFKVTFKDVTATQERRSLTQRVTIVNYGVPAGEELDAHDELIMEIAIGQIEQRDGIDDNELRISLIENLGTGERLEY
jgi:hypothetical protein